MIIFLVVVFGGIFAWNGIRAYMTAQFLANFQFPPAAVSTAKAQRVNWNSYLTSVGTLDAVDDVEITSEVGGIITAMPFTSGQLVKKGGLLVKINDDLEQANLINDQAVLKLAEINFERLKSLYNQKAMAKSALDEAQAKLAQAEAAVAKTKALIAQKNIVAPYDGKIGIKLVDLWQYISPGTPIASLQSTLSMRVNFYLPEHYLPKIYINQPAIVTIDALPDKKFTGKITAINTEIDPATHNILVQATLPNNHQHLTPGMFANVKIELPSQLSVISVPKSAIEFSLSGNNVYVIQQNGKDKKGNPLFIAKRRFVTTGDTQDNRVLVTSGLNADEEVVTSGQLKLKDGGQVIINNSVQLK